MGNDPQETNNGILVEARPETGKRQEFFNTQRETLQRIIAQDLYSEQKARAEFLSGMATQLLENESFDELTSPLPEEVAFPKIEDNRRQISKGLEFDKRNFDLWKLTQATDRERLTPEQTVLVLKGYALGRLCVAPKQAFKAIEEIAKLKGQERPETIKEFLSFIHQVRERAALDNSKWQAGNLKIEDYPFHFVPENHLSELDTCLQLEEFWYDPQEGRYKYLREEK